jgi:polysaccharide export outer membrane protein
MRHMLRPRHIAAMLWLALTLFVSAQSNPSDAGKSYVLRVDDLIEIKVFDEDDLTTRARISGESTVTFPLLGATTVAGKTVQQAEEHIRARLAERFLVKPQVNLTVMEHARKLFTVLGQVQRAGTYKFPDRESLNLIQAIGMAGGYTRIADPSRVTVKRLVNGKEVVLTLDAKSMARSDTTPVSVAAGDIITVGDDDSGSRCRDRRSGSRG